MKNVSYILGSFPVFSETFIGNEIRALRKQGHKITVIAMQGGNNAPAQKDDEELAAEVIYLSSFRKKHRLAALLKYNIRLLKALPFLFSQKELPRLSLLANGALIAMLVKQHGSNHIHAHFAWGQAAHAIVAAKILGISVSFTGHGADIYARPQDLPCKLKYSDTAIAVCQDMVNDFKKLSPETNIELVCCGVDTKKFECKTKKKKPSKWIFVGRLVESKGVDDLLCAIGHLPQGKRPCVDIVGDGPVRQQLEKLTETLDIGEYIKFLGKRPATWLQDNMGAYKALIAPFKQAPDGDRDTGPLVVKEAMAQGLPVVSTEFMGVKEMVTDETGILVLPGNITALAQAISTIEKMPKKKNSCYGKSR